MRTFTVTDWEWSDLMSTGTLQCVGLRPQRLAAAEPYCHRCDAEARPIRTRGRWDNHRQATALPYVVVWVLMSCGCKFGDESLAEPCPTCSGQSRETVGMVCQTCGTDYAASP